MDELYDWAYFQITREGTLPNSIGAKSWEAVDEGKITDFEAKAIIMAFVTAGMDTTAGTLGNILALFVDNPDQWDLVQKDPSLVPRAVNEGLRMDPVAQWFSRMTTRDVAFGDVIVPAGSRALHWYAAANRDERKFPDPDRFDVMRNPTDILSFGYGPHSCVGRNLSNMQMIALLTKFAELVTSIEQIGPRKRHINNLIRSLDSLPVRVEAK